MRTGAADDMTDKVFYLLHGLQDRYSALYQDNIARLGPRDVLVASIGSSGQSYLGGILAELGLNYADAYTEALREDGASEPVSAYDDYRERLATPGAPRRLWPRFVKTHLTPRFFTGRPLLGVWILVRDPRDALYSWYRFRTEFVRDPLDRLATSFEDWLCRPGPTGLDRLDDWADFHRRWLCGAGHLPRSAITAFEDLKRDPLPTLRAGLRAFGLSIPDSDIAAAVLRSDFQTVRRRERDQGGDGPGILRRGQPEEWRTWMSPSTADLFGRAHVAALARRFGYHLGERARS
ncbi:sulfotransferase domain-containing protein [Amycolatopsis thermoflava]|uniref:sulfotransferase domain-containing protein n=1 Tax=Amycolatopsis thermoflava TaxID=84480 RepID=UPI00364BEA92